MLKTRLIQNAHDYNDPKWDDVPHLFFDDISIFYYNMSKLQALGEPIEMLKEKV